MKSTGNTKRFQPHYLFILRLHWYGETIDDIAARVGQTPAAVRHIINLPASRAVLEDLQSALLDTTVEVANELQLISPIAVKRLGDLMYSGDDRVALVATREVLHMSGHKPVAHVAVTQATLIEKKYDGLTEAQLRARLLEDLSNDDDIPVESRVLN